MTDNSRIIPTLCQDPQKVKRHSQGTTFYINTKLENWLELTLEIRQKFTLWKHLKSVETEWFYYTLEWCSLSTKIEKIWPQDWLFSVVKETRLSQEFLWLMKVETEVQCLYVGMLRQLRRQVLKLATVITNERIPDFTLPFLELLTLALQLRLSYAILFILIDVLAHSELDT